MSLPASDNFTVDNFAVNWVVMAGSPVTSGGAAFANPGGLSYARWSADSFNADQYGQIEQTFISTFNYGGPCLRLTGTGGTACGYLVSYGTTSGTLYRIDNGGLTNIGSLTALPGSGTKTIKLEMTGTSIQASVDTVADGAPVTDATYATGQVGGFFFSTFAEMSEDNWLGDNLGGGGGGFLLVKN